MHIEDLYGIIRTSVSQLQQVTEQVSKLMSVMDHRELSGKKLMVLVGLNHRPTFRQNHLSPAIEQGLIEMTIPDKANSSKQKYRMCTGSVIKMGSWCLIQKIVNHWANNQINKR